MGGVFCLSAAWHPPIFSKNILQSADAFRVCRSPIEMHRLQSSNQRREESIPLSRIIDVVNDWFGTEFNQADADQ